MEYKRFGDTLVIRIDRGEEITEQLRAVCERESVRLAEVSALGAVDDFTVGVYNVEEKKYYSNRFQGPYEIVSLTGTVTTKDGAFYSHLHMSAGDLKGQVFGGHLNSATVSATCEMVLRVIDGTVERRIDERIGLNVFQFDTEMH